MQNYPIDMSMKPDVEAFFDAATNTISYVISDPKLALLGSVEIIFSIGLCATTAYLVRQIREAQAVD